MKLLGCKLPSSVCCVPSRSVFNAQNNEIGMATVRSLGEQFPLVKRRRLAGDCHVVSVPGRAEMHVVESAVRIGTVKNDLGCPSGVCVHLPFFE